jgi:adenylate cyclase
MNDHFKLDFFQWMARNSVKFSRPEDYIHEFIQFLNKQGLSIVRASLGGSSLHPEIDAFGYIYINENRIPNQAPSNNPYQFSEELVNYSDSSILKLRFRAGIRIAEVFVNSPIPKLWEHKKPIYISLYNTTENPYPIIEDLRKINATLYYAQPLLLEQGVMSYISLSSTMENGFSSEILSTLQSILEIFALGWFRFRQKEMIESLLSLYLGPMTGPQVLAGRIRRGDVETKEAIIWFSDIRDYTSISSNYPTKDVIVWLNEYYQAQITNIHKYGGEVLKIMGDGMLAIFPTIEGRNAMTNARKALVAAHRSIQIIQSHNKEKKDTNLPQILHGIALHKGNVEYGNIGSKDRLDFTIIGSDVNLTSRICSLCSSLNKEILLSEKMSELLPGQSILVEKDMKLKGISSPQNIFQPGKVNVSTHENHEEVTV